MTLKTEATKFSAALDALVKATESYYNALHAIGLESGDATGRGLNSRQIESRLRSEIIARLNPRDGLLKFEGAPEARRFVAANKLPGLS